MVYPWGYYEAMGQTMAHKLTAFRHTVPHGHRPHWNFHESVFAGRDWTQEPSMSLPHLYAERARQIRERYDFVALSYSGGADSQNIAEAFVRHDLRIDFLINRYSGQIDHHNWTPTEEFQVNETIRATVPNYQKLLSYQPDLEILHWDWSKDIIDYWQYHEPDICDTNYWSPNTWAKARLLDHIPFPANGKSVIIYGVDKPRITLQNGRYTCYFLDEIVHNHTAWFSTRSQDVDLDLFYWSPDSVDLLIKQAHILKRYFKAHPEHHNLLDTACADRHDYNAIANNLIYPWWNSSVWQCRKSSQRYFTAEEKWFVNNSGSAATERWSKVIKELDSHVKNIFLSTEHSCTKEHGHSILPGCYSRFYDLGP